MATGRRPAPTALKRLKSRTPGTDSGGRPLPENEPEPTPGVKPPAWLKGDARREWRRIYPELTRLGLVTVVDQAALVAWCQAVGHLAEASKAVHADGCTWYTTPTGQQKPTAAYRQQVDAAERVRKLATEFGFTPASRSRVVAKPPQKQEAAKPSLAAFLGAEVPS